MQIIVTVLRGRLTAVNEVYKSIVYIIGDIIVFFYQRLYGILCLMLTFWLLSDFWWKDFIVVFLYDAFHSGVRQISRKLVFCQIIVVYSRVNYTYKGMQIVQKLDVICDTSKVIWFGINIWHWSTQANSLYTCWYTYFLTPVVLRYTVFTSKSLKIFISWISTVSSAWFNTGPCNGSVYPCTQT